jgi:hypothetical protein
MKTRFQHGGHGVQTRRATEETEKRESEKEDGREDFNTEGTESGHGGPRRNSKAGDRKARRKEEAFGTEKVTRFQHGAGNKISPQTLAI